MWKSDYDPEEVGSKAALPAAWLTRIINILFGLLVFQKSIAFVH